MNSCRIPLRSLGERSQGNPELVRFFQVIRSARNALPQEKLIGLEIESDMGKEC